MVGTYMFSNIKDYVQIKSEDDSDEASTVIVTEGPGFAPRNRLNLGVDFNQIQLDEFAAQEPDKVPPSSVGFAESKGYDSDEEDGVNLADVNPSVAPIGEFVGGGEEGEKPDELRIDLTDDKKDSMEAAPGGAEQVSTSVEPTKEQLDAADWWTRFYATIQGTENYQEEEKFDALSDSEDSELSQRLDEIEYPEEHEEQPAITVTEQRGGFWSKKKWWKSQLPEKKPRTALEKRQLELEKKRKKRIKKKKLRQRIAEQFKGDAKRRYQEEFYDLVYNADTTQDDKSWVEKIQLYPIELEEVLNHNQFDIPFRNLPLYKGKQKEDEVSPESRLAGYLKCVSAWGHVAGKPTGVSGHTGVGGPQIASTRDSDWPSSDDLIKHGRENRIVMYGCYG
ncbi:unnamed protein product [Echinostoma caproni]|uniref:Protein KRI1 homolog n=1 Tax=Echinostoma caproni TaxID=27848 RepID=A0A183B2V4_9TREM|nr:unnamed protein product [Echinostoma caproni]